MDAKELQDLLEEPFKVPDLAQLWPEILRCHRDMGFSIPLTDKAKGGVITDNDMIAEFQWIYSQYRKYIGTKKAPWLSMQTNLPKLIANIQDAIEKDSKTPTDRTELVYQAIRNEWLLKTWNHYAWLIEQLQEEDDDE